MTMKWILVTGPRFRVGEDQEEGKAGEMRKVCLGHSPVNGVWRRTVRIKHPGLFVRKKIKIILELKKEDEDVKPNSVV